MVKNKHRRDRLGLERLLHHPHQRSRAGLFPAIPYHRHLTLVDFIHLPRPHI